MFVVQIPIINIMTAIYLTDKQLRLARRNSEIVDCYDNLFSSGMPSTDAVVCTADIFKLSDRQVFNIISRNKRLQLKLDL